MKKTAPGFLFFVIAFSQFAFSFDQEMPNLKTPLNIEEKEGTFTVVHHFDHQNDNPFNISAANVLIGFQYMAWQKLSFSFDHSYITTEKEIAFGAGYSFSFPQAFIETQIDFQYLNFEPSDITNRQNSFFILGSLRSLPDPVIEKIRLISNIGYDSFNERPGLGFGIDINILKDHGTLQALNIFGEYLPVLDKDIGIDTYVGDTNTYTFGVAILTYGHQFLITAGNTFDLGTRRLMLGSDTNRIFVGFNIKRHFDFGEEE